MRRREFLLGLVSSPLGLMSRPVHAAIRAQYSMVLGPTDATSFQVSVLHHQNERLRFFVRLLQTGQVRHADQVQAHFGEKSPWVSSQVVVSGLPEYAPVELLVEDSLGILRDVRRVHWLDSRNRLPKIVAASCAAEHLHNGAIWEQLNRVPADLVLFLGDNVYADRPNLVTRRAANPEQLWKMYISARRHYSFFFQRDLRPCYATWDDHDYGINDGDRSYKYAAESARIFHAFWPQSPGVTSNLEGGPGVASRLSAFGMDFVMLDSRSFRSAPGDLVTTMWGDQQMRWLSQQIACDTTPLWLGNGQQFFGGYRGNHSLDCEYVRDFEWLVDTLRGQSRPTGFMSGDVHYSEVMRIEPDVFGFETCEITSSSLHSLAVPGQHALFHNPRRLAAASRYNFLILDMAVGLRQVNGIATCVGAFGETAFTKAFGVHGF